VRLTQVSSADRAIVEKLTLAEDALAWTDGRALVATGSPFQPVDLPNGKQCTSNTLLYFSISTDYLDEVAQTNNALIYPALGLGAILARSRTISPSMLMAGVHALASLSPALHNPEASLLPDLADVRKVSVEVAAAVVRQAVEDGNATDQETIDVVQGKGELGLEAYIKVSYLRRDLDMADLIEPYVGCRLPTTPVGRLDVLGIRIDLDIYWHVSLILHICGSTA
jgi:hypothetical protein